VDAAKIGAEKASHHQVISDLDIPLGEGNSIFISVADSRDQKRAPSGKRPVTISTHTKIEPWWRLYENNRDAYLNKRAEYADKLLTAATSALPGLREAVELSLPGTPVTFDYYTGRHLGMVGGFPQESLFSARGPGTGVKNLWLVGDSIFPGQSTAGVTLGAIRVAAEVTKSLSARPRIVPAALNPSVVGE
jgi:phytoene dehydrogenase-like protein